jgi:hypothetical protein
MLSSLPFLGRRGLHRSLRLLRLWTRLVVTGNMSGTLVLSISDPQNLVEGTTYRVATYGGTPPAAAVLQNLTRPWMVSTVRGEIRVFKSRGTILSIR